MSWICEWLNDWIEWRKCWGMVGIVSGDWLDVSGNRKEELNFSSGGTEVWGKWWTVLELGKIGSVGNTNWWENWERIGNLRSWIIEDLNVELLKVGIIDCWIIELLMAWLLMSWWLDFGWLNDWSLILENGIGKGKRRGVRGEISMSIRKISESIRECIGFDKFS